MSKQPKKSAKNTETQDEVINQSWFMPDNDSLQKQQDEHNRLFNQEKTLAAVASWMEENLPALTPEQQLAKEPEKNLPPPSGDVLDLMEEFGVDRKTAEKWADMI